MKERAHEKGVYPASGQHQPKTRKRRVTTQRHINKILCKLIINIMHFINRVISGLENYKSVRWISAGYPLDEIHGPHPIFGQRRNIKRGPITVKFMRGPKNFLQVMYVFRQNYWTFISFVDFLFFQSINLIRWNLSIVWWKVLGPFRQPRNHPLIRWISTRRIYNFRAL